MATKNLGKVKFGHTGTTPPTDTTLLWKDTNPGINRWKEYVAGEWKPLASEAVTPELSENRMWIGDASNQPVEKTSEEVRDFLGTYSTDEVDSQMQEKVDKVDGDNQLEVTITTPSTWYGAATQMLRAAIQKIHDYINNSVFKVSDVDVSDIDEGQFKIPLVQKVDGEPVIQGSSELIDKLAAQSILSLLSDNANWGNVTGKSGDFIKLEGDNSTGQLGENSQELYDNEGQYFLCISHVLDNPGEATWVRNRNRDALKAGVTQDDAVISELEEETNWNTTTNIKIISVRSKVGSWHKSEPEGYLYHCYKETGTPPNQWYWYRSGLPATEFMQVLNTGNYTGLVTALAGHDWSTGAYDPSGLTGERGTQGQEYYDVANRKLYKCVFDEVNSKIVWEQINLVKS